MNHRFDRPTQGGFTLIEMLVSLALFALLGAAGVFVLAQSLDAREVVDARVARLGELQRARALLRADLAQAAVRRTRREDGATERNAFNAQPAGASGPLLSFVRRGWSNPDGAPRASLQQVEYRISEGRLERRTRPLLDGAPASAPLVLLRDVREVRTFFYDYAQWSDGWGGGAERLPAAVALEMDVAQFGRIRQVFLLPGGRQ
ncbi:type II secretion system minor pseudopilin GspJ [Pseudoxanthomonas composti]|uniref:Type II secretion system protein J n=1 Tax=Pseudoxanthomonas composti TaxID=2137479 RepID=A0A4V1N1H9_9GAMM|nr:type II secretion system minor pseudopilin GspJ [Pseudoxanthomonas composti]RXR08358.1 type II secretion system protein GspJ [Pseudoxanthomonas composti]